MEGRHRDAALPFAEQILSSTLFSFTAQQSSYDDANDAGNAGNCKPDAPHAHPKSGWVQGDEQAVVGKRPGSRLEEQAVEDGEQPVEVDGRPCPEHAKRREHQPAARHERAPERSPADAHRHVCKACDA